MADKYSNLGPRYVSYASLLRLFGADSKVLIICHTVREACTVTVWMSYVRERFFARCTQRYLYDV